MIRRGAFYDGGNEPKPAREELERALARTDESKNIYQRLRTQIALSSAMASDGQFEDAQKLALSAMKEATENRLETIGADGLVRLAGLIQSKRPDEAAAMLDQAIQLAQRHGSRRIAARARVQLAQVRLIQHREQDAIDLIDAELPFLQASRYRRTEFEALAIKARWLQSLDKLDQARTSMASLLSVAETTKNEAEIAQSAGDLSSVTAALGGYPEAVRLRERVIAIRTQQGDKETLPFHYANLTDLLIRLGRTRDADRLLSEIEANVSTRTEYESFGGRAAALRVLLLATTLRCDGVLALVMRVQKDDNSPASARTLAPVVGAFCDSRGKRPGAAFQTPAPTADRTLLRERHYWIALAALERGDAAAAMTEIKQGLALLGDLSNDELRWRLAAVGAVSARITGDEKAMTDLTAAAKAALGRVRSTWNADFQTYVQRADLIYLRKRSGLS